jgi:hypothetical protein
MKNRCAGLVVVLFSLSAFGVASAEIEFSGVIDPQTTVTRIDSVTLRLPDMTFLTPGWGSHFPYDTFIFSGVPAWPETLRLHGTVQGFPTHKLFIRPHPKPDTWYGLCLSVVRSYVKFYGTGYGAVEEPKPAAPPLPRLAVSPSVVTGQMTVTLQPASPSIPVVEIHDAVGNLVRSLNCTAGTDGAATATWNREDKSGHLVPEGVYFCRYAASDVIAVRKVLVAR